MTATTPGPLPYGDVVASLPRQWSAEADATNQGAGYANGLRDCARELRSVLDAASIIAAHAQEAKPAPELVTAGTPGQAAYEAAVRVMLDGDTAADRVPDDGPDFAWDAIAAQEPQPAPGDFERAFTLVATERNQLRWALGRLADNGNLEARERLAKITPANEAEPQPAPGLPEQVKRLVVTLRRISDQQEAAGHPEGAYATGCAATMVEALIPPPGCGCTVCEATGSPHGVPQPAPELAAAMAEARELRKVISALLGMFKAVSGGWGARTSSSRLRRIAEQGGVHWDEFPPGRTVLGGTGDTAYRDELVKLIYDLEASSQQTSPSKKSDIERSVISRLQAILEGK